MAGMPGGGAELLDIFVQESRGRSLFGTLRIEEYFRRRTVVFSRQVSAFWAEFRAAESFWRFSKLDKTGKSSDALTLGMGLASQVDMNGATREKSRGGRGGVEGSLRANGSISSSSASTG